MDDENVSSEGFSPVLPGELTKISSALALIKVSRILAKVLDQLYPPKSTYEISLNKLYGLADELDEWSANLPTHLRLQFSKDKPSTNVTSCRSPTSGTFTSFYCKHNTDINSHWLISISEHLSIDQQYATALATRLLLQLLSLVRLLSTLCRFLELLDERRMNYTFPCQQDRVTAICWLLTSLAVFGARR